MDEVEKFENSRRLHDIENNKNNKQKTKSLQQHAAEIKNLDENFSHQLQDQRTTRERV